MESSTNNNRASTVHNSNVITLSYITPKKACSILNVTDRTLANWTDNNQLSCIKTIGGHRRYIESEILDMINNKKYSNTEKFVRSFLLPKKGIDYKNDSVDRLTETLISDFKNFKWKTPEKDSNIDRFIAKHYEIPFHLTASSDEKLKDLRIKSLIKSLKKDDIEIPFEST